jgi:hypothetical protein
MYIMNKDNTYGNKFWTPEQQQAYEEHIRSQQQLDKDGLNELEEIPDNIKYYKPDAIPFTEAEM